MPIRYVSLARSGGRLNVLREIILKDGSAVLQVWILNPEAFSIRAGEYGLDPIDDADTVWDILLNEPHLDPEDESPLLTEDTLEDARAKHLNSCRKERDKLDARQRKEPWTAQEKKDHEAVLSALRENVYTDRQLALLHRDSMRQQIKEIKRERAEALNDTTTPVQRMKRDLLDKIRQREQV